MNYSEILLFFGHFSFNRNNIQIAICNRSLYIISTSELLVVSLLLLTRILPMSSCSANLKSGMLKIISWPKDTQDFYRVRKCAKCTAFLYHAQSFFNILIPRLVQRVHKLAVSAVFLVVHKGRNFVKTTLALPIVRRIFRSACPAV